MFRIKICGVTRSADVATAIRLGADALGFNFYPQSPRYVPPAVAAELVAEARRVTTALNLPKVTCVGVFVNESAETMRGVAEQVGLDALQLHGDDVIERIGELTSHACLAVLRIRAIDDPAIAELAAAIQRPHVRGVLIDAYSPDAYGGTGHQVAWDWIPRLQTHWGALPTILAGGLRPANVADAIATAKPLGIDVASGVEASPGIKDSHLLEQFITTARHALDRMDAQRVTFPPHGQDT